MHKLKQAFQVPKNKIGNAYMRIGVLHCPILLCKQLFYKLNLTNNTVNHCIYCILLIKIYTKIKL